LKPLRPAFFITALAVLTADQATKALVQHFIRLHESIPVIPHLFQLTYLQNQGTAFGLFSAMPSYTTLICRAIIVFTLVTIGFIIYLSSKWSKSWQVQVPLGLILGGALGNNIVDRIRFCSVVDFLDFGWDSWRWYVFNAADSSITVGVAILLLLVLFHSSKVEG